MKNHRGCNVCGRKRINKYEWTQIHGTVYSMSRRTYSRNQRIQTLLGNWFRQLTLIVQEQHRTVIRLAQAEETIALKLQREKVANFLNTAPDNAGDDACAWARRWHALESVGFQSDPPKNLELAKVAIRLRILDDEILEAWKLASNIYLLNAFRATLTQEQQLRLGFGDFVGELGAFDLLTSAYKSLVKCCNLQIEISKKYDLQKLSEVNQRLGFFLPLDFHPQIQATCAPNA
jgi:hypothetical protein